jgi:hypothetical protein
MNDDQDERPSETDAEIEREIRRGRKFNLAEAIGRMAGPGAMKGVSPVPRMRQAVVEIENWLRHHMPPGNGELEAVLNRWIAASELMLNGFEQPLVVLAAFCRQILDSDYQLKELVREADVEWGREQRERPHFDKEGLPPHPDDPYTIQSVRDAFSRLLIQLASDNG